MRLSDPLRHLVAGRSWDWLLEVCRLLAVKVELIDSTHAPQLRTAAPRAWNSGTLDPLVLAKLRPAMREAANTRRAQLARHGPRPIIVCPLRVASDRIGAVVLAPAENADVPSDWLGRLGVVLGAAIERHLGSPTTGVDLVAAMLETLQASGTEPSDRRLVEVFADALAVWHDIDVVGFVETARGVFVRAVALPGHTGEEPPLVFPPHQVPRPRTLTRMPSTNVDAGSRAETEDLLVSTLTRVGDASWLLTFGGAVDACEPALLTAYVAALDLVLAATARAASAELALTVAASLVGTATSDDWSLAMQAVGRAVRCTHVEYASNSSVLAAAPPLAPSPDATAQPTSSLRVSRPGQAESPRTLTATRVGSLAWTPRERAQCGAVADVLENREAPAAPAHAREAPPRTGKHADGSASLVQVSDGPASGRAEGLDSFGQDSMSRVSRDPAGPLGPHVEAQPEWPPLEEATIAVLVLSRTLAEPLASRVEADVSRGLRADDRVLPTRGGAELVLVLAHSSMAAAQIAVARARTAVARTLSQADTTVVGVGIATRMRGQEWGAVVALARRRARA
jgi:hypothetical protein